MYIEKLRLNNFRNYNNQEIEFGETINIFYGDNAVGKTNILEAIYICGMGKSFRTKKDKEMINLKCESSKVEMDYRKKDRNGNIKIELANEKNILVNDIKLKKLSEILGNINIVIFSPDDMEILKDGPSKRRRFLDIMISQLRPNYVYNLNQYLKTLDHRNAFLRQVKFEKKNIDILDVWDEKLAQYGVCIYNYRLEFINKIKYRIKEIHDKITDDYESIEIHYLSDCIDNDEYLKRLKESRNIDIQKGYTTKGIHRDDFMIYIDKKQVNIYGSQGQNRTIILSLKLSELEIVHEEIGEYPILLLDDFMSELDEKRRVNFLKNVEDTQIIITCTDRIELEKLKSNYFNVKEGKVCTYI